MCIHQGCVIRRICIIRRIVFNAYFTGWKKSGRIIQMQNFGPLWVKNRHKMLKNTIALYAYFVLKRI